MEIRKDIVLVLTEVELIHHKRTTLQMRDQISNNVIKQDNQHYLITYKSLKIICPDSKQSI